MGCFFWLHDSAHTLCSPVGCFFRAARYITHYLRISHSRVHAATVSCPRCYCVLTITLYPAVKLLFSLWFYRRNPPTVLSCPTALRSSSSQRCSWLSLYSINFVSHKTYYWSVETENQIDGYVAAANPPANEGWESEVRDIA